MDRCTEGIGLKDQNGRPLRIGGVVLDDEGFAQTSDHVSGQQAIGGEFIIAVGRDSYLTSCGKRLNARERRAHPCDVPPVAPGGKSGNERHRHGGRGAASNEPGSPSTNAVALTVCR